MLVVRPSLVQFCAFPHIVAVDSGAQCTLFARKQTQGVSNAYSAVLRANTMGHHAKHQQPYTWKGATTVAAWSARARPGLGVSVPIEWAELASISSSAHWTIKNIESRLAIGNQPWQGYTSAAQGLASAIKTFGFKSPKS